VAEGLPADEGARGGRDGGTDGGRPCEATGHHGFAGIEVRVVDAIAAFVAGR